MIKKANNFFPKISIIIPSYNKGFYIKDTLDSIFNQNYPNFEVIIQDGRSTDGSLEIIKDFAKRYPKIIKWTSEKDDGQANAINNGMKKVSGGILAYLNADDIYNKGALFAVGDFFQKNPDVLWAVGYGNVINSKREEISAFVTCYKKILLRINSYTLLLAVDYIMQPSAFLTKDAFLKYGPFIGMGTKKYVMEYDLWLKLGKVHMPGVINKNISSFRLLGENASVIESKQLLAADYQIVKSYTSNPVVLLIHYLHNFVRIGLISILK